MNNFETRKRESQEAEDSEQVSFLNQWRISHPDGDNSGAWAVLIILAALGMTLLLWGFWGGK